VSAWRAGAASRRRTPVRIGRAARGQALAEALVALLALVPLWLAIFYVSRWHDLQQATIAAARHAAFESWVGAGRTDADVAESTRRRLFGAGPARIPATGATTGTPSRWRDHRGAALLAPEGPLVTLGPAAQPLRVEQAERLAFGMIAPARAVGGPPLDLQRDAARGATVVVPLLHDGALPAPFAGLRFSLRERLEILVDPWAARAPVEVARRVDALSPTAELRALSRPLEPVRWAVGLFEPAFERLCLGRVDTEIVPADRLRGGRLPLADLRTRPC
jgi:hypothetical protein